MNYIKLFVTVFAMAIALGANAQSKTTAKSKSAAPAKTTTTVSAKKSTSSAAPVKKSSPKSSYKSSDYDRDLHLMLETRLGSGIGENLVLEKEYHKYVAVDFFSLGYTSGNWSFDSHKISLKTGARGFSPRWWGGRMRAYTDLGLGYDCVIFSGSGWGSSTTSHGFGLTWGLGVHMFDHFYLGYSLDYTTISMSVAGYSVSGGGTSHYFKFGYRF